MMRGLHPSNSGELPMTRNMPFATKTMPSKLQPRNMTGIYLGLEGNVKPPTNKFSNVPALARGRGVSQRIRTPTEHRRYKMVEQLRIKEEKRGFVGQPLKNAKRTQSAVYDEEERRKAFLASEGISGSDSPRTQGARKWGPGKTVDRTQFFDLIKTNPRNYTVVVNNGVTRSENLSGMMSFGKEQYEIPAMPLVETLASEVNRMSSKEEEEALGLEECFKKVCKGNVESLQSLLPYRKVPLQREHTQYSTGFTVRSYRNPNQAEIMANFSEGNTQRPRTVPADYMHNRPIVPSPYFFRIYNNPYNKLHTSSSSAKSRKSAPSQLNFDSQLSSIASASKIGAAPGAGILTRSLKTRSAAWSESDIKLRGKLQGTPRDMSVAMQEEEMEAVVKEGGKQVQISMKLSIGQEPTTSLEATHTNQTNQADDKMMETLEKTSISPREKKNGFEIEVADEHGKASEVEIDSPEEEANDPTPIKGNVRKASISEKVEKSRVSQAYIETIKESAEKRKKQFEQMLDEHAEIVQEIGRAGSTEELEKQRDH